MNKDPVILDEINHDLATIAHQKAIDAGIVLFECKECHAMLPLRQMEIIVPWADEGCCGKCALNPIIAEEWGL